MVSFGLYLKEQDKELEDIVYKTFEGEKASALFSKVEKEFSAYSVKGNKEDQPFLYMKIVPIADETTQTASIIPTAYFQVEAKDRIVDFIETNLDS